MLPSPQQQARPSTTQEPMSDAKQQFIKAILTLKDEGNHAYEGEEWEEALDLYQKAIELDPDNLTDQQHVLLSNSAACYIQLERWAEAEAAADKVIDLKPSWPRGYERKGKAMEGQGKMEEACQAYTKMIELQPSSAAGQEMLKRAKKLLKDQMSHTTTTTTAASSSSPLPPSSDLPSVSYGPNGLPLRRTPRWKTSTKRKKKAKSLFDVACDLEDSHGKPLVT